MAAVVQEDDENKENTGHMHPQDAKKSDDQELKCGSGAGANDSERELLLGKKSLMELGDKENDLNTSMGQGEDEKEILRTNETSAQTSNEEIKEKNILQENPRTNPNNYFKGQHLKDKVMEGRIVDTTMDNKGSAVYFIRVDKHSEVFGKKDIYLHGSKLKDQGCVKVSSSSRVRFQLSFSTKGPIASWAQVIGSRSVNLGRDTDWKEGIIVGTGEDKNNQSIYFVKALQSHQELYGLEDIFLHGYRLSVEDRFFRLQQGTRILFKVSLRRLEDRNGGRRPDISDVEVLHREYNLQDILAALENSLKGSKREQELIPLLNSKPAFAFLGNKVKEGEDVERLVNVLNQLCEGCTTSTNLLKEALNATLQGAFLIHKTGSLQIYIDSVRGVEKRSLVLELFVHVTGLLPMYYSRIHRLIKGWTEESDRGKKGAILNSSEQAQEGRMVSSMLRMLKSLGRKILQQQGEADILLLDYQEQPLIPTRGELWDPLTDQFKANLLAVKPFSPYRSVDEYMETYWKLQRAEGYATLIQGIQDFNAGRLDNRDMNVYNNISLVGISPNSFGIQLALRVHPLKRVKDLSKSRHLMDGNLLCISVAGDFSDPVWAKVSNRHEATLNVNVILVELIREHNQSTTGEVIEKLIINSGYAVMAETPTYYRSFGPVLTALQKFDLEEQPLKNIIVRCSPDPETPLNLTDNRVNIMKIANKNIIISKDNPKLKEMLETGEIENVIVKKSVGIRTFKKEVVVSETLYASIPSFIKILQTDNKLDQSQAQAITHALTNKMAIIQGPPGAGKTFLGTQLVEILLNLERPSTAPILVITYKNHALDEFLAGLIDNNICKIEEICRVGGQGKDSRLQACNLYEFLRSRRENDRRIRTRSHHLDDIFETKREIRDVEEMIQEEMGAFTSCLGLSLMDILEAVKISEDELYDLLRSSGFSGNELQLALYESQATLRDISKGWWNYWPSCHKIEKRIKNILKDWMPNRKDFRDFKSNVASIRSSILETRVQVYLANQGGMQTVEEEDEDATDWHKERAELNQNAAGRSKKEQAPQILPFRTKNEFVCELQDFGEDCPLEKDLLDLNIFEMSTQDKIKFLYALMQEKRENTKRMLSKHFESLESLAKSKEELEAKNKAEAICKVKIVGMTITGASINNALMNMLAPEVVLVEEAAEILEPQLLVALTPSIKHLIQIGDHHQLPPQVDTYELKKTYNFDVSMMQRLVQNNLPFVQLRMQNRMRPDISCLLKDIYPRLEDNMARVASIPLPNVLMHSSIFWCHNSEETSERSKMNATEVDMALSVATMLVSFGTRPSQITILCTYLGQTGLMKKKMAANQLEFNLKETFVVSTVDNYQGDENDIVIVSLVRSNSQGQTGFLKDLPRRCVAQSRAKSCVIFIGNKETIIEAPCWKTLIENICFVGHDFPVVCPDHPSNNLLLNSAERVKSLARNPSSLCDVTCGGMFPCELQEHICRLPCQPKHEHTMCTKIVPFTFEKCGHPATKRCFKKVEDMKCMEIVDFNHGRCGHPDKRVCHVGKMGECTMECKMPCQKMRDCGKHPCSKGKCGDYHSHSSCFAFVDVTLENCGHSIKKGCSEDLSKVQCRVQIFKTIPKCGHGRLVDCYEPLESLRCKETTTTTLDCGHLAIKKCMEENKSVECSKPCNKTLVCKHKCMRKCSEPCENGCQHCKILAEKQIDSAKKEWNGRARQLEKRLPPRGIKPYSLIVKDQSELDGIKSLVHRYIEAGHEWCPQITKVERVINPALEVRWYKARSQLHDPTRDYDRKFHGTGEDGVQNICFGNGFKLPEVKKNDRGGMFGQGVYFASCSSKSAQEMYTKKSNKLLLCNILLGRALTATKAMNGARPREISSMGYDSVYAAAGTLVKNDEFVVYDPDQALPAYIIHYKQSSVLTLPASPIIRATAPFKKTVVKPRRTLSDKDPHEFIYMLAERQFYKCSVYKSSMKIQDIDVFENLKLETSFANQQSDFTSKGVRSSPNFGFYACKAEQINHIMKDNFCLEKMEESRHGPGVLFSDAPEASSEYKPGCLSLIFCKLLLGNPGEHSKKVGETGSEMPVLVGGETGSLDQILPIAIVNFKQR